MSSEDIKKSEMFAIGQFSKMSNTTMKQLRYLDEKDILKPDMRDKNNKYRYYSEEQLEKLIFISSLRDLDIPFEEILKNLNEDDFMLLAGMLRRNIKSSEEKINKAMIIFEKSHAYWKQLMEGNRIMSEILVEGNNPDSIFENSIKVIEIPKNMVLFTRYDSSITAQHLFINRMTELKKMCDEAQIVAEGSMYAIFHDSYIRQFVEASRDMETIFFIKNKNYFPGNTRSFGGFKGVSAIHIGHYKNMLSTYEKMELWAEKKGIAVMEKSVEKYIIGPDMTTNSEKFLTELILPFECSEI